MAEIRFFLGANNGTGEVEFDKVEHLFWEHTEGITIQRVEGRTRQWGREATVVVQVFCDTADWVMPLAREICRILEQDAILVVINHERSLATP